MTPDEGRISSNNSNSTDNDERADDLPKEFLISYAVIHFLFFLFCLFMVIYLSIRLKKRAWDSPAKRFANIFNICFALVALFIAVNFIVVHSDIVLFILFFLSLANYLYFIAMYVALSLKVVTLFLSERLKLYAHKTHCVRFTEIASHVFFLLLAISYSVFHLNYFKLDFPDRIIYLIIMSIILIVFLLSYSFLFLAFVFLMKFFKYHNSKKKGVKYMIIKLLFLLIVFITYAIIVVLVIHFNLTLHFWSLLLVILHCVFYFILSILVVPLNHPLDIWCCKCHFRRSPPSGVSMVPVNNTEGQQTNPISVWDHRNVPSCTPPVNLPYEMSDCRSDYEMSDCRSDYEQHA